MDSQSWEIVAIYPGFAVKCIKKPLLLISDLDLLWFPIVQFLHNNLQNEDTFRSENPPLPPLLRESCVDKLSNQLEGLKKWCSNIIVTFIAPF